MFNFLLAESSNRTTTNKNLVKQDVNFLLAESSNSTSTAAVDSQYELSNTGCQLAIYSTEFSRNSQLSAALHNLLYMNLVTHDCYSSFRNRLSFR
jgi:hypothetical protein